MFKNNFKALLIHGFTGLLSIVVYVTFFTVQYKWSSEAAYRRHELLLTVAALAVIISALLLYYFSSMLLMKSTGSIFKNMLSVSSIAVIGLIWWIGSSVLISSKSYLMNYHSWFYYCLYNSYSLPLIHIMNIDNMFVYLIFPLIPSLVMGLAVVEKEMKHRKLEKRKEQMEKELIGENKNIEVLKANYEKDEKEQHKNNLNQEKVENKKKEIKEKKNKKENKEPNETDNLVNLVEKEASKKKLKKHDKEK